MSPEEHDWAHAGGRTGALPTAAGEGRGTAFHQADGKPRTRGKIQRRVFVLTVSVQEGREGTGNAQRGRRKWDLHPGPR